MSRGQATSGKTWTVQRGFFCCFPPKASLGHKDINIPHSYFSSTSSRPENIGVAAGERSGAVSTYRRMGLARGSNAGGGKRSGESGEDGDRNWTYFQQAALQFETDLT